MFNVSFGLEGLNELINIHPLFVHFPVALLLTTGAFYALGHVTKKEELFSAGKWVLYFGTLSAALAVWTGLEAAKTAPHIRNVHETLMVHQYIGFTVLGLSTILSACVYFSKANIPVKGRRLFLIGLVILALLIMQGADLGGRMVFLNGVGVGRKSMMQDSTTEQGGYGHKERVIK